MTKLSVVIPAYMKQDRAALCLQSVLGQTLRDIEVIVVWRKGADKTEEIIKSFSDPRLRLIEQTEKTGAGGAREIGVQAAKGDYIGFVDCDDTIDADFYEKLYTAAVQNDTDIAFGGMTGHVWKEKQIYAAFADKYALVTNGAVFDKIFKTDVIKNNDIHFPVKVFYEDNPWLLMTIWYSGKLVTVPDTCYRYFDWDKDDSRMEALKKSLSVIAEKYAHFIRSHDLTEREKSLIRAKFVLCVGGSLCLEKDVFEKLVETFGYFPELFAYRRKRRLKSFKRRLLHLSFKKRQFNILGLQFKFGGKQ
mgnify:FL=1